MAASHHALNPHAAPNPDLLRNALANSGSHHTDLDSTDHLGCLSGTPSGVATPRPSGTDKRSPGILHSFFGQVGETSFAAPPSADFPKSFSCHAMLVGGDNASEEAVKESATAPASEASLAPCPQKGCSTGSACSHQSQCCNDPVATLAAPSQSATSRTDGRSGQEAKESRTTAISRASRPSAIRLCSGEAMMSLHPLENNKNALSRPLSNITINSPVHALHLSNPTTSASSTVHNSPTAETFPADALSSLHSHLESIKLTNGMGHSTIKATPPITPRTLSNDGNESVGKGSSSSDQTADRKESTGTSTPQATRSGAPVPSPKGKLMVKVSGARGLRPSFDPYAVCVFEWTESIAHGRRDDDDGVETEPRTREDSMGGLPMKRLGSEMGRSMAIPMKSRQSSTTSLTDQKDFRNAKEVTDPVWDHEAVFDVVGKNSSVDVDVYDRANQEAFLGHVNVSPDVFHGNSRAEGWYKLEARDPTQDNVSGEVHLKFRFENTSKKKYGLEDFEFLKLVGKGTFGQVYQVRKKDTQQILALKMLSKKVIIQKKEVEHTIGERNILVRTASADSPFIVGLKYSFQTPTDLFLVTGFMSGGELFNHLQKAGRFEESRAKFYIAELILALQHLHQHDIVYRDLKPENILLDANGHIALCDFGLSKANLAKDETTNTFCGTTEYLAPEVLLDEQGYTKMVDFWSLGVLVFEMCCGWSPFYADDTQQMYKNIAFGKVRFPKDTLSTEGRNFVKGLLNRNPRHRLGAQRDAEELKEHRFFADTDWNAIMNKSVVPPFKPKLKNILDVSNFDPEFTEAYQTPAALNERATQLATGAIPASTPLSPGMQANFKGFTYVGDSHMDDHFRGTDLERMDEDAGEDADWEHIPNRADRMSGIIKTGSNDDGLFNSTTFDM